MPMIANVLPSLGFVLVLVACGSSSSSYNDAELACQESFELENACREESGNEVLTISKEQQCASAVSAVGGDDAAIAAKAAQFDCSAAAWGDADCSTAEGAQAASDAVYDCFN